MNLTALVPKLLAVYTSHPSGQASLVPGDIILRKSLVGFCCCCLLLPLSACSSTLRTPQLLHPGSAPFQRQNATQFDPYPMIGVGPEIVGGRPIDFQKPPNEVERARQYQSGTRWRAGSLY